MVFALSSDRELPLRHSCYSKVSLLRELSSKITVLTWRAAQILLQAASLSAGVLVLCLVGEELEPAINRDNYTSVNVTVICFDREQPYKVHWPSNGHMMLRELK